MPFGSSRKPNQKKKGKQQFNMSKLLLKFKEQGAAKGRGKRGGNRNKSTRKFPNEKRKLKSTADKSSKQPKQFRESANFIDENDEKKRE